MRDLFLSESRYISNILAEFTDGWMGSLGPVIQEYYAPPRAKSGAHFNNDYFLDFSSSEERNDIETKAYGSSVLPNTLGVQVFLTVDERTSKPLMTELLGGEAFSIKHFKDQIEIIESHLSLLSHPINLRRSSYCRILVVGRDICFLAFPNNTRPVARGSRQLLCDDGESSIACCSESTELVYIDGWIRTDISESDGKLEAIAAPN